MSARNLQSSPGCEPGVIPALSEEPLLWAPVNMSQFLWRVIYPFAPLCGVDFQESDSTGKATFLSSKVSLPCAWGSWGTERGSSWDMQVTLGRGSWRCPKPDLDFSALHWAVLLPFQHGWKQILQGRKLQEAQMGMSLFWVSNVQEGVGRNLTDALRKTIWTQTSFLFGMGCLGCSLITGSIMASGIWEDI